MLIGGAIIVCLLSFFASLAWARLKYLPIALVAALVFPLCASWLTYWVPVLGTDDIVEYRNWFWVVAPGWLMVSLPVSVAATLWFRIRASKRLPNG